ncbi:hypothetical protein L5515_002536 [Caenorhabditis briggsae]|uniref:Uncharacterized protein n=1 Tax=Caenorhabditis briggsae TaxID=6238 RepID=A0AAE9J5U3_CAEBR|nr:hypothetical protein L5515_002536 [Caenorhabditis briggsae]
MEKCVFCAGLDHKSIDCFIYWNSNVRRKRISSQKRCLSCLEPKCALSHSTCPRQNVECSLCSSASRKYFHHLFLCNFYSIEKPTANGS